MHTTSVLGQSNLLVNDLPLEGEEHLLVGFSIKASLITLS